MNVGQAAPDQRTSEVDGALSGRRGADARLQSQLEQLDARRARRTRMKRLGMVMPPGDSVTYLDPLRAALGRAVPGRPRRAAPPAARAPRRRRPRADAPRPPAHRGRRAAARPARRARRVPRDGARRATCRPRADEAHRTEVNLLAPRGSIVARRRHRPGHRPAGGGRDRLARTWSPTTRAVRRRLAPILDRDPNELANALAQPGRYAVLARNVPPRARRPRPRASASPASTSPTPTSGSSPGGPIGGPGDRPDRRRAPGPVRDGEAARREPDRDPGARGWRCATSSAARSRRCPTRRPMPGPGRPADPGCRPSRPQVESTLAETREATGAKSAMAIVMDPRDGSILAMASVPRFNPNERAELNPELERNRPVVDTFEPGSTFKIATMTAALEDGKVTPWTRFVVPGPDLRLRRRGHAQGRSRARHRDDDRHADPGAVEQHRRLQDRAAGRARTACWPGYKRFGFGSPTGIDFPGEAGGYVLPGDKWYGSGITNVPIGQGVSVTLTQLTRAYAAIANGGLLVKPHLVKGAGGGRAADHARVDRARRSTGCSARWCPTRAPASWRT